MPPPQVSSVVRQNPCAQTIGWMDSAANVRQAQDEQRRVDGAGDDNRNRLSDWSLFEPIRKDRAGLEIAGARYLAGVAQPAVVLDEIDAVRLGLGDHFPDGHARSMATTEACLGIYREGRQDALRS